MKTKICFSITLMGLFFAVCEKGKAQAPAWEWVKQISGPSSEFGTSMALDILGNVYTTGHFYGTVDFDPSASVFYLTAAGSHGNFISKLDSSGNFIWAVSFTGGNDIQSLSLALDAFGNVYTTGLFSQVVDFDPGPAVYNLYSAKSGIFVSKLNSSGNFVWAKAMVGTTSTVGYSISIDSSANVYTTGYFSETADFDPDTSVFNLSAIGNSDIFISKLDSSGNFVWAKQIGGTDYNNCLCIKVDNNGNVYGTGIFSGTTDFNPDTIGSFNLTSTGIHDIFILKLDASGNFIWAKAMGGTAVDAGYSIAIDTLGSVVVTGFFRQTVDFDPGASVFNLTSIVTENIFILKLDQLGNFVWVKGIGGPTSAARAQSIALDDYGNIYITGSFNFGSIDFDPDSGAFMVTSAGYIDFFISKFDSLGNFVYAKTAGGTSGDGGSTLAIDAAGHPYLMGYFQSTSISFGSTIFINPDTSGLIYDLFIAKLGTINTGISTAYYNNDISLFPNPVLDVLYVSLKKPSTSNTLISITDIQGRVVREEEISQNNSSVIPIDVSTLSQGVYLLRMYGQVQRFVKM